jgi:hypothetical protein
MKQAARYSRKIFFKQTTKASTVASAFHLGSVVFSAHQL